MTTPAPDDWIRIANITDVAALQLLSRLIQSEVTMLEARLNQLNQLNEAVNERMQGLGKSG